jgi:hypothetical protein
MMDEDVFLDETILEEDEAALLLLDRDEALASRLSRWKRPALPADLVSGCSRSVGTAPPSLHTLSFDLQLGYFTSAWKPYLGPD